MAYYCMVEFHWTPSQILEIMEDDCMKAFVNASIQLKIEAEKKERRKIERGL